MDQQGIHVSVQHHWRTLLLDDDVKGCIDNLGQGEWSRLHFRNNNILIIGSDDTTWTRYGRGKNFDTTC
eukprot:8670331-Ditylum_brightwellii.AAC.2